jgi:hypothetical protein
MADQEWQFREFAAPNGEQDAATFLNEALRQGHGEASTTLRNNGTAGLFFLEPGSLGTDTSPSWVIREFPGPGGEQAAADFLNEPLRQGAGEASVTLRNDGSAGLLFLEPGSLGDSTTQTWLTREFSAPNGAQAAVDFLNAPPRQGQGEAAGFARNDGSAAIIFLEPGSG